MTNAVTKQHFLTLDFLRGTAAFCVLLLHWFDGVGLPYCHYGYLAVDFFFLLSGFVIAHSYEQRLLSTMSVGRFLWIRFIRLYPLIVIGVILGLVRAILRAHFTPEVAAAPIEYLLLTAANLVMLPIPQQSVIGIGIFPLDAVLWSLLFELAANALYAICVGRLTYRVLVATVLIGFVGLVAVLVTGIGIDGSLNAGAEQANFLGGFARITFSFTLGILVYRLWSRDKLPSTAAGPWLLSAALVVVLCLPEGWLSPWAELVAVTILFPAIVVLGANQRVTGYASRVSRVLGDLSYPVYVLQVPVMWIIAGALKAGHVYDRLPLVAVGAVVLGMIAVLSWGALKFVDEPVRRFLAGLGRTRVGMQNA